MRQRFESTERRKHRNTLDVRNHLINVNLIITILDRRSHDVTVSYYIVHLVYILTT